MRVTEKARAAWSEAQDARRAELEMQRQELEARNVELAYGMGEAAIAWLRALTESDAEARVIDTGPLWAFDRRGCEIEFDGLVISVRADDARRIPPFQCWLQACCPECGTWQEVGHFVSLEGLGQLLAEEVPVTGCTNPDCPDYYCTAVAKATAVPDEGPPARELSPESHALLAALDGWVMAEFQVIRAGYNDGEPF